MRTVHAVVYSSILRFFQIQEEQASHVFNKLSLGGCLLLRLCFLFLSRTDGINRLGLRFLRSVSLGWSLRGRNRSLLNCLRIGFGWLRIRLGRFRVGRLRIRLDWLALFLWNLSLLDRRVSRLGGRSRGCFSFFLILLCCGLIFWLHNRLSAKRRLPWFSWFGFFWSLSMSWDWVKDNLRIKL